MKTQFLSTLINRRTWVLFFSTLLSLRRGEAGNAFRNCLKVLFNDTTYYDLLLNYPFNTNHAIINGDWLDLCCKNSQCTIVTTEDCLWTDREFFCKMLVGNVVCDSGLCQGIIGDQAITTNGSLYGSNCLISKANWLLFALAENLISTNLKDVEGLDQGYAGYACRSGYCQGYCNWDNGGWICSDYTGISTDYCYMQWTALWPGSVNKNPSTYTYIPTVPTQTTSTSTNTPAAQFPTPTFTQAPANHLVEKIAIPVGVITGTSLVSGLTYYYCQKKRRRQRLITDANNQQGITDLANQQRIVGDAYQQQALTNAVSQRETNEQLEAANSFKVEAGELPVLNQLGSPTPSTLPLSPIFNAKQILLNELQTKLTGNEQLWTDYLEVNNLMINNPHSQYIVNQFNGLQTELLKILTIGEIGLLLENEVTKQTRGPQTEYSGFIEEGRHPQWINPAHDPQAITNINSWIDYHNPEWRGN